MHAHIMNARGAIHPVAYHTLQWSQDSLSHKNTQYKLYATFEHMRAYCQSTVPTSATVLTVPLPLPFGRFLYPAPVMWISDTDTLSWETHCDHTDVTMAQPRNVGEEDNEIDQDQDEQSDVEIAVNYDEDSHSDNVEESDNESDGDSEEEEDEDDDEFEENVEPGGVEEAENDFDATILPTTKK